jgi:antitoxin VapB
MGGVYGGDQARLSTSASLCVRKKEEKKEEGVGLALNIKNPETERLARELARRRGTGVTEAVTVALQEELKREQNRVREPGSVYEAITKIAEEYRKLPVLDDRTPEEILEYDENGLPR